MAILITSFFIWGPGPTNWDFCMAKSNQLSVWGQGPLIPPPCIRYRIQGAQHMIPSSPLNFLIFFN